MNLMMETRVTSKADDRPSSAGLGWLRNKRILLAEDNITNQMVATQMLDALGASVDVANDGAEALEMIGAADYDLFLIDIEMPRVSGLDVIRSIRGAAAPLCDAPVIAVTAYALREHRDKITEAGADGLIPKPLLGIEQFGRDIVSLADQSFLRAAEAEARVGRAGVEALGGLVSLETFTSLREALGPEAMADLLIKVDADLALAETSVREGAANIDRMALKAATHVLTSVAGAIGAHGLQALARRLGDVAASRSGGDLERMAADALRQIAAVRDFVREKIAEGRT
jgi:CheY-like chemotaxis protein